MINVVKIREDITGWKMWEHGIDDSKIIVVKQVEDYIGTNGIHHARYLCKCNCGNEKDIFARAVDIKDGSVKSCGCLRLERIHDANKKYNPVELNLLDEHGSYGIGYCLNTGSKFYFDMDDYELIKEYCWSENIHANGKYKTLIANIPNSRKNIRMTDLLGCKYYDHADRNSLNNRRYNLRPATISQNNRNISVRKDNTSGFIGVNWNKNCNLWIARIQIDGKDTYLGGSKDKNKAIKLRLEAEAKYYGEFAPQQHLFEQYGINFIVDNVDDL